MGLDDGLTVKCEVEGKSVDFSVLDGDTLGDELGDMLGTRLLLALQLSNSKKVNKWSLREDGLLVVVLADGMVVVRYAEELIVGSGVVEFEEGK